MIPNVRAKGKGSVRVADILNRMQAEEPVNSPDVIIYSFKLLFMQTKLKKMHFYKMMHTSLPPTNVLFVTQMVVPEINTLILLDREVTFSSFPLFYSMFSDVKSC